MPKLINPHYQGQRNFNAYDQATPSNQDQFRANAKIEFKVSTGKLTFTPTGLTANTAQYYVANITQGDKYEVIAVDVASPAALDILPLSLGFIASKPVEILFEARGVENGTQAERLTGSETFADLTVDRTVTFNNL